MGRTKLEFSKERLHNLYYAENMSPRAIGDLLGCSFKTITNRLQEYGIPLKSPAFARMRYKKFDFSRDLVEKAYLIGFRLGDLAVSKTSSSAETVVVRLHTTHDTQINLFKKLFEKYGKVVCYKSAVNPSTNVNAYLNSSFDFLMPKHDSVESWIVEDEIHFRSFAAGYIDAEGTFGIYQGRARFKMDAYDRGILSSIHVWLNKNNISNKFFRIAKQGDYVRYGNYYFKKDVWRINVNEASALLKFTDLIRPYLKHGKRKMDMQKCVENIKTRKLNGSIK